MHRPALPRLILPALLALSAFAGQLQAAVVIGGPITNPANGHAYYVLSSDTWQASQNEAVKLGGNLATINDAAEQVWVFDTFANFGGVIRNLWIGLTDQVTESSFTWMDTSNSTFRNWAVGADDGLADKDSVCVIHPANAQAGKWMDLSGSLASYDGHPLCGLVEAPKLFEFSWRTKLSASPIDPVALSRQGLLYVVGGDGKLRAIDSDGKILWEYPAVGKLPPSGTANLIAAEDGSAMVAAGTNIIAISSKGNELWKSPIGELGVHWLSKLALAKDGTVICAARSLIGLEPSGRIAWKLFENQIPDGGHSEIALNGKILFFAVSNTLHKITTDGVVIRSATLPYSRILGVSVIDSDHILAAVSGGPNNSIGYSKIDSELSETWFYSLRGGDFGDPGSVNAEGEVYVTNGDGIFASIEPSGLATWRRMVNGGLSWRPPIVTKNGLLICTDGMGKPVAYDRDGFEVWQFAPQTTSRSPVIGQDGRTIWPSSPSPNQWELVCYSTTERVAPSIWPMHRGDSQRTGRAQEGIVPPPIVSFGQPRLVTNGALRLPFRSPKPGKLSLDFSSSISGPWELLFQTPVAAGETSLELPLSAAVAKFFRARFGD